MSPARPQKIGSKTERVWAIADEIAAQTGAMPHITEVVRRYASEGGNDGTARTQFGHWKHQLCAELSGDARATQPVFSSKAAVVIPTASSDAVMFNSGSDQTPGAKLTWHRLFESGFVYGSHWRIDSSGRLELDKPAPESPGVYAFALADNVVYIGKSTHRTIAHRMQDYRSGSRGQTTSHRVNGLLKQAVADGHKVVVLYVVPGFSEWNGLRVDLTAGLEQGLIDVYSPSWNMVKKKN